MDGRIGHFIRVDFPLVFVNHLRNPSLPALAHYFAVVGLEPTMPACAQTGLGVRNAAWREQIIVGVATPDRCLPARRRESDLGLRPAIEHARVTGRERDAKRLALPFSFLRPAPLPLLFTLRRTHADEVGFALAGRQTKPHHTD